MIHALRCTAHVTIFAALWVLTGSAVHAQIPPTPAARFCPAPGEAVAPAQNLSAPITPSVAAGMAAFSRRAYVQAYANLRPLADGNAEAARDLGIMLRQSCGADKSAAAYWFQKAASDGDIPAAAALGNMQMFGDGIPQDDSAASKLLTIAAIGGNSIAQTNLGELYFTGRGVAQDGYQGVVWSVRAGEQGEPVGLFHIGREYANGRALPKDAEKALFFMAIGFQRLPVARRSQFQPALENMATQLSIESGNAVAQAARKWAPAAGALSRVLADADTRRGNSGTPMPAAPAP